MDEIGKFIVLATIAGATIAAAKKAGARLGIPATAVPVIAGALYLAARRLR
ncbi:hypothetical protein ACFQFC_25190 [Amorphoplanes digitatis]|uniref:Uncharacterized protein n=1 Tax=Actinoplanes digitatis TaxID=1868 RepID=A0A7W7I6W4_9ACTN|nr:hypothetical protein [Actinoplanes digitatis]MBB4767518.1 hypothetical protein [Actinoplanes digitatis]GID97408.1 hypothetical protein Adi01nite_68200 [Actinoplanes digitatis]